MNWLGRTDKLSNHGGSLDPAVGIDSVKDERRQVAVRRVGDRAQDREGRPPFERKAARRQAFHVDCRRSGRAAQFRLGAGGWDRSAHARNALDRDTRSGVGQALREGRRDGLVGRDASLGRDDFRAENEIARAKPRIEAAADAPTNH